MGREKYVADSPTRIYAPALERELYLAQLLAAAAVRVADVNRRLDALEGRVAKVRPKADK